jgi:hypothetical protein
MGDRGLRNSTAPVVYSTRVVDILFISEVFAEMRILARIPIRFWESGITLRNHLSF